MPRNAENARKIFAGISCAQPELSASDAYMQFCLRNRKRPQKKYAGVSCAQARVRTDGCPTNEDDIWPVSSDSEPSIGSLPDDCLHRVVLPATVLPCWDRPKWRRARGNVTRLCPPPACRGGEGSFVAVRCGVGSLPSPPTHLIARRSGARRSMRLAHYRGQSPASSRGLLT